MLDADTFIKIAGNNPIFKSYTMEMREFAENNQRQDVIRAHFSNVYLRLYCHEWISMLMLKYREHLVSQPPSDVFPPLLDLPKLITDGLEEITRTYKSVHGCDAHIEVDCGVNVYQPLFIFRIYVVSDIPFVPVYGYIADLTYSSIFTDSIYDNGVELTSIIPRRDYPKFANDHKRPYKEIPKEIEKIIMDTKETFIDKVFTDDTPPNAS